MTTHKLINGEAIEVPDELAPRVRAYLGVISNAAADPDIDYRTLFSLVYSPANPLLSVDRATGGAVVRPEVLDDPVFRLMSDILARKGLMRSGRTVDDVAALYTVPVAVAAEQLGISTRSVRLALTERRMAGMKKDGEWFTSPEGVEAYKVAKSGPRGDRAGSPLVVHAGGENGFGLKFRADPRAKVEGLASNTFGVNEWVRVEVLTYMKGQDSARFVVLEPGDTEDVYKHGPFSIRGAFKITERINNTRAAREAWREVVDDDS